MQAVLPRPDIAPVLQRGYVALASDCDDPEPQVLQLAMQLKNAMMLPFVLIADADGNFLDGSSGLVQPAALLQLLQRHAP